MSSTISKVPESKDLDIQTPRVEASDQSKNGGGADPIEGRDNITSSTSKDNTDSKDLNDQVPREEASDQSKNGGESDPIEGQAGEGDGAEEDGEEEGECGFCLFMKGGGCKDSFTDWEKCVEEAEKNNEDVVEKCFQVTSNLKKCMEAHAGYYEPILQAEKAAEETVNKELQQEQQEQQSANSDSSAPTEISEDQQVKS